MNGRFSGLRWVCVMVIALGIAACGGKSDLMQDFGKAQPDSQSRIGDGARVPVRGQVEYVPPTQYFKGVGMRGVASGNIVTISLHNRREETFLLKPTDFGVIVDGKLTRVMDGTADLSFFPPPLFLETEATVVGAIRFPGKDELAGQRLVFNNPVVGEPFFVEIEKAE